MTRGLDSIGKTLHCPIHTPDRNCRWKEVDRWAKCAWWPRETFQNSCTMTISMSSWSWSRTTSHTFYHMYYDLSYPLQGLLHRNRKSFQRKRHSKPETKFPRRFLMTLTRYRPAQERKKSFEHFFSRQVHVLGKLCCGCIILRRQSNWGKCSSSREGRIASLSIAVFETWDCTATHGQGWWAKQPHESGGWSIRTLRASSSHSHWQPWRRRQSYLYYHCFWSNCWGIKFRQLLTFLRRSDSSEPTSNLSLSLLRRLLFTLLKAWSRRSRILSLG